MDPRRQGRAGFGGLGFVVKGVAGGVGLASEAIHHHKEKKAAREATATRDSESEAEHQEAHSKHDTVAESAGQAPTSNAPHEEHDDEQWDLDDAQDGLATEAAAPKQKNRPFEHDPKKITQHFIDDYPLAEGAQPGRLELPVVLPQRRPKNRTRGFIRAYAPELMNCGIDQAMFLDFLETFNLASQSSPWLNAINLASFAFMPLPTGINQAASVAIMLAVQVAKNMQSRHRYNSFLDQVNDQFYRPRGLYCLVMTWEPESTDLEIGVNVNETIHENLAPPEGIAAKAKHSLRPSMGKTNGVAFGETAPLVFPDLDTLGSRDNHEAKTQKEKLKSSINFVNEYYDRRAQAQYGADNPDSKLLVAPRPSFTSRYSDPTNPSNSGDILALLTGGKVSMPSRSFGYGYGYDYGYGGRSGIIGARAAALQNRRDMFFGARYGDAGMYNRGASFGYGGQPPPYQNEQMYDQHQGGYYNQQYQQYGDGYGRGYGGGIGRGYGGGYGGRGDIGFGGPALIAQGVKRILRHHVLYLLIVNMPTEEEMSHATHILNSAQAAP